MQKVSFGEAIDLVEQASEFAPSLTGDIRKFAVLTQKAVQAFDDKRYLMASMLKNQAMVLRLEKYLHDSLGIVEALEAKLDSLDCEEKTQHIAWLRSHAQMAFY